MAYTQREKELHSSVSGGCYGHQMVGCSQLVEAHNLKLTCTSGTKFGIEPALQDRISFYYLSGVTRKNRTNTTIAGQSAKEIDRQPILKKFKTQFQHMWKVISVCMYDCQKMLSRGVLKLQTPVFYRAIVAISNHFSNKEGVAAEINEGSRFWKKVELVGAICPFSNQDFHPCTLAQVLETVTLLNAVLTVLFVSSIKHPELKDGLTRDAYKLNGGATAIKFFQHVRVIRLGNE